MPSAKNLPVLGGQNDHHCIAMLQLKELWKSYSKERQVEHLPRSEETRMSYHPNHCRSIPLRSSDPRRLSPQGKSHHHNRLPDVRKRGQPRLHRRLQTPAPGQLPSKRQVSPCQTAMSLNTDQNLHCLLSCFALLPLCFYKVFAYLVEQPRILGESLEWSKLLFTKKSAEENYTFCKPGRVVLANPPLAQRSHAEDEVHHPMQARATALQNCSG